MIPDGLITITQLQTSLESVKIQILGLENGNYTAHAKFNGTLFLKESANHVSFEVTDGYS